MGPQMRTQQVDDPLLIGNKTTQRYKGRVGLCRFGQSKPKTDFTSLDQLTGQP